jgi:hypothetical protein
MTGRAAGLLLFAIALASCAELRWQKAGGDDATLMKDQAACNRDAQAMYGGATSQMPPVAIDPRFGPMDPSQTDMVMRESQMAGTCMRAKGAVLVPDNK